jgi:TPP-dependent pyruvate/acetoin dehydrogenase alpha subunit
LNYRSTLEIEVGLAKCPIERYKKILSSNILDINEVVSNLENKIQKEIESAFNFSSKSPEPAPSTAIEKLYA